MKTEKEFEVEVKSAANGFYGKCTIVVDNENAQCGYSRESFHVVGNSLFELFSAARERAESYFKGVNDDEKQGTN